MLKKQRIRVRVRVRYRKEVRTLVAEETKKSGNKSSYKELLNLRRQKTCSQIDNLQRLYSQIETWKPDEPPVRDDTGTN